jgi:hypothetical protein
MLLLLLLAAALSNVIKCQDQRPALGVAWGGLAEDTGTQRLDVILPAGCRGGTRLEFVQNHTRLLYGVTLDLLALFVPLPCTPLKVALDLMLPKEHNVECCFEY